MPPVLLVTCADLPNGDEDGAALLDALTARGVDARWVAWTDPAVDWSAGLTVLRSSWDYTLAYDSFLTWASAVPRLANPIEIVIWNSDKTYLRDLADAGLPIVSTAWAPPGSAVAFPDSAEFVVKPSVGAGSKGAGRFAAGAHDDAAAHVADLHRAGRTAMVQPYLTGVDVEGETALMYVEGTFSHAIRKGAMLPPGVTNRLDVELSDALQARELFIEERIEAHTATAQERAVGDRVLAHVEQRFGHRPLYTRVDLLPAPDGPVLVELELVEPSMFLGYADGAAATFADAIATRVAG